MSGGHYVIIGNGPAANEAAATLRETSADCRITLIGQELVRYYKPHLLPDFIAGKIQEEDLYGHTLDSYQDRDILLRLGQRVVGVDFGRQKVILEHREMVSFDGLIIAVGGKPKIPEPLERFSHLMLTLKTVADARSWIGELSKTESILMIGGDLTSLSLTKALLSLGKRVTFMLNERSLWPLHLNEEIEKKITGDLLERGVNVVDRSEVRRIDRVSRDTLEVQTDTAKIRVGLVGAFYGLTPDLKFLSHSGLDIDRGILVNEYLQTRYSNVFAAGDCAQVFHPETRDYWISIGYANARTLGRLAATNLAGGHLKAEAAPESVLRMDGITVNLSWWMEF